MLKWRDVIWLKLKILWAELICFESQENYKRVMDWEEANVLNKISWLKMVSKEWRIHFSWILKRLKIIQTLETRKKINNKFKKCTIFRKHIFEGRKQSWREWTFLWMHSWNKSNQQIHLKNRARDSENEDQSNNSQQPI